MIFRYEKTDDLLVLVSAKTVQQVIEQHRIEKLIFLEFDYLV